MKRVIKFRGKRLDNNKWEYGYITAFLNDAMCISLEPLPVGIVPCIKVDPASVGQFTGLKDRNGKEIYEGDILQVGTAHPLCNPPFTSEVYWNDLGMWALRKDDGSDDPLSYVILSGCEVVGNIHDKENNL